MSALLKISRALGLEVQIFSEDDEARLITDLRETFTQTAAPDTVLLGEIKELASGIPAVARTLSAGAAPVQPQNPCAAPVDSVEPGQAAFQKATQIALLEMDAALQKLTAQGTFTDDAARALAPIDLANYFADALLLPYGAFLQAAESLRCDIDYLGRRFGVGFKTVCHRLSTLQRNGARGVPFFFIRVDSAGKFLSGNRQRTFTSPR